MLMNKKQQCPGLSSIPVSSSSFSQCKLGAHFVGQGHPPEPTLEIVVSNRLSTHFKTHYSHLAYK